MNNRKWLTVLLVCMLAIGLLAGCSSKGNEGGGGAASNNPGNNGGSGGSKDAPIKLTMWGGVPPESGPQAAVDNWNAENPDIQVEYIRFVNDDEGNLKLDTALLTGQNVDLFVGYDLTRLTKRVESGAVLDLSEFTDYPIVEKIGPDSESWKIDGKFYGIPTKKSVNFVALNKDMLDEAGLEVPKEWTWQELREYAKILTKDNRYGFIQHLETFPGPMDSILDKTGYVKADGASNMDDPKIVEWLELMNGMMSEDKSTPPLGEQITSKMPVENVFLSGEAAMLNIGEWLIRSSNNFTDFPRDFEIAFAPVPRMMDNPEDFHIVGGLGDIVSINAKTKHKEAAWEFLKWYTDGGMTPLAAGGRLPASKEVDQEVALKSLLGGNEATYDVPSLNYVLFEDPTVTFVSSIPQEMKDMRRQEYEKYFLGNQSVADTVANMVKRHNEFLKK
ncbi:MULTISPECIES: ABC transporter substrate-binding protein [unclassified Paenibacillus]|uniref:ABC transporter substrate-binding protein n=1 Tax=unclassified Paenibacillus TaxID=185978 RepID=UPI002F414CE5